MNPEYLSTTNPKYMLFNYLVITLRHLRRQSGYTTLNILGFTIGLLSSFLIILYLHSELSYDKHIPNADRIFRISSDFTEPDNTFRWAVTQNPLGEATKTEISEVEQYTRIIQNGKTDFIVNDILFYEQNVFFGDSTFFDVFAYDFVSGDAQTALHEPNSIVLNETLATKFFKDENPIGQIIKVDEMTVKVTGVYKDLPSTSHIIPRGLISASSRKSNFNQHWGGFNIFTYVLIRENVDVAIVDEKLDGLLEKYVDVIFDQYDVKVEYELINIQDIHLTSTFLGEPEPLGSMKYIYIFAAIGFFLIIIASINYMNLSTAKSIKRSLEVGIRKVMGARRESLVFQFVSESILLTSVALFISVFLLMAIVPLLNEQLNISLSANNLFQPNILLIIVGMLIFTSLLSGSYPAFFLSSFRPVVALKGKGSEKVGNKALRRVLVAVQFALSIFMLIGTFVIYQQMQFLRNKDLGFDKEKILKVALNSPQSREKWPVLKKVLSQNPLVQNSSTSTTTPGGGFGKNLIAVETNDGTMEEYGIDMYGVDYDYFDVLSVPMAAGRNISRDFPSDTATAVLVNEAMVKRLNWDSPIGKKFQFDADSTVFHRVVGVVRNFHQQSLYNPIEALMFIPQLNNRNVMIKTKGDVEEAVKSIENSWKEVFPELPFEYAFLDTDFMEQYETDQLRGKLFLGFSIMMIFISCLGLLGLASFIAEQRTKEISIRKVLGANTSKLVGLLVKDFLWLVLLGAIPAFAFGYYFMNEWLANFEYHIEISFIVFIVVLLLVGLITVLTTGFHAFRAASSNPADNLRNE
ncbi:MAG: ABC transporter permease [Cyclobacteriaceae bacterium]